MELYLTYHKVLDKLQQFQENYCCLNSFGYGNLVDFGKNVSGQTIQYPYLYVVPQAITYDQNTTTYQLSCIFADRLNESMDNEKDAVSDMSLAARQLLSEIWRGNLQDYFDAQLPVNAQPFMERFNDYVAGVALDLNVTVMEDINACEQWIITPFPTPTMTPSPTAIPPTPSITPSPTPSPVVPTDPKSLGALWWIDYTDATTLTLFGNSIATATDKVHSIVFTADTAGGGGPVYDPIGYLGVSGTAQSNATQLQNAFGDYSAFTEYTFFTTMYDDPTVQRGGRMIAATNNGVSWPGGQAFLLFTDNNIFPYPPGPVWRVQSRAQSSGSLVSDFDIPYSAWTLVAFRVYTSGGDMIMETWQNGTITDSQTASTDSPIPVNNPIFSLMFDGGFNYSTEQFFFDRKLTNTEMAQVLAYINNKY